MHTERRAKGPELTEELAAQIKSLWLNTKLNQAQIAAEVGGINQGRVSEVLQGKRYPDVPPADREQV